MKTLEGILLSVVSVGLQSCKTPDYKTERSNEATTSQNGFVSGSNHDDESRIRPAAVPSGKKGMTWGKVNHDERLGIDLVGCYGGPAVGGAKSGSSCDAYQGDTSCSACLPILCLKPMGLPRPNYAMSGSAHAMPIEYYRGWTGGIVGITEPVQGTELSSLAKANAFCEKALGPGFRMAEFHDGKWVSGMSDTQYFGNDWPAPSALNSGGWTWYAQGNIASEHRFWVHINDQASNCWGSTEPAGLSNEQTGPVQRPSVCQKEKLIAENSTPPTHKSTNTASAAKRATADSPEDMPKESASRPFCQQFAPVRPASPPKRASKPFPASAFVF